MIRGVKSMNPLIPCSTYIVLLALVLGCAAPKGFGIGGHYNDGKFEVVRRINPNKAIAKLEYVVRRDPLYRDSLTLLGRSYYNSRRYQEAFQFLARAIAVKPNDEIAQISLGLTQLRLGDDVNGLERFKGGLTLLIRVSKDGYKDIEFWDKAGMVRSAIRKAVFVARKGLGAKRSIIRLGESLLIKIDDEEWHGKIEHSDSEEAGYAQETGR